MSALIIGNTDHFAIESCITRAYTKLSQRALGCFVIHVGGHSYGVHAPEATMLACSLDAVQRRIERRGQHTIRFATDADALKVAEAVLAVTYDEVNPKALFFGMSHDEIRNALVSSEIVWAPDGDAAFDDGGHILQFDVGDEVRLIAFINSANRANIASSLIEVWMNSEEFYGYLDEWQRQFQMEWMAAITHNMPNLKSESQEDSICSASNSSPN